MFDGIDVVTLPAADLEPLTDLYTGPFGFVPIRTETSPDPAWQTVLGLSGPPARLRLLGKPGSAGGWIRLAEIPGLPEPAPAGRPDRVGPYALDFFLRDAPATERAIEAACYPYRAEAARYELPGTTLPVHERILDQPHSGLIHATIQYRARGTRCILDHDPEAQVSEVAAVVFLTDTPADAVAFATDVLGAEPYFSGAFAAPGIRTMLFLDDTEQLPITLLRGPRSRNARLEFAAAVPGGTREPELVPRLVVTCAMDDLDALAAALAGGRHGVATPILSLDDAGVPTRHLGFRSRYGASFDFVAR